MKNFTIGIGKGTLSMMKRFSWLTLVIVLVVAIAVTGCGGGGGKKKNNDTNGSDGNDDGGTMVLEFDTKWGEPGDEDGKFYSPHGVAVDSAGNVYVADRSNNRIQKFTSNGIHQKTWGSEELNWPIGVAVDNNGNVYVADNGNDWIHKFEKNLDGSYSLLPTQFNEGEDSIEFNKPTGVAIDSTGNIYITDQYNHRILKFASEDGTNYTLSNEWGSSGTGNGQFTNPYGIAVDKNGNVYVAENGNDRIQKFDSEGNYIWKWGTVGSEEGQFRNPHLIAVDKDDNIYVADTNNDRIQKFNSAGSFLMQWGSSGSGEGQFYSPTGVAVDQDGNVYVADSGNNRIQKFKWVKK